MVEGDLNHRIAVIYKIKAIDGKIRHIKIQSTPITYEGDQRAIQIVGQDVTGQIEYERELKESLKEKETLLQEIHHRVKNNLAVVSGMMDLQTFSTENEEVRRLLTDSKNRIKTMALIHEKLYQSASLSQIEFGSYVKDLINNIKGVSASDKEIKVELEYDSFNLNVNQAVPCALIINEVVANAFEHAFTDQESGLIKVTLENIEDKVIVSIKDNGRGLPSDFEYRKSKSIGMTIIETLIQQLEAEQKVKDKNGVSFTFSFEMKEIKGSSSALV
ncbi:sensor histidine kinase [Fodinibius sp.]|uniref:sensor histidine kinase n=1 Tax=Fodinibius sp. TaxID=1872440 RepID=UPI002ACDB07E|nr:histidine kinase dimerization/phosphoacceptor domain -containing protein [Fodinibius sp.]MDZ7659303.1 histidine kinase dimerization/phosphoacceptor domain -containing protein [Fodinibius sp.]